MAGREGAESRKDFVGVEERGKGKESDVRAGLDLDEVGADMAAREDVPSFQHLIFQGGIEVELDSVPAVRSLVSWSSHLRSREEFSFGVPSSSR